MSTWYMKRRLDNEAKQKGSDVTVATSSVDVAEEKPIEEKKVAKKKVKKED